MSEMKYRLDNLKMIFSLFGGTAMLNLKSLIWMTYRMVIFGTWGKGRRIKHES